jgi:hypothetical protein
MREDKVKAVAMVDFVEGEAKEKVEVEKAQKAREQSPGLATNDIEAIEAKVSVSGGDLRILEPHERVRYYRHLCAKLGLDPTFAPIQFVELDGKLRPYITRAGAEMLRAKHGVSTAILKSEIQGNLFIVLVRATTPDGRTEESVAVADLRDKRGNDLGNACLFAETKAKRRATLSLLGLGYFLDETEVLSIQGAKLNAFDPETGSVGEERKEVKEAREVKEAKEERGHEGHISHSTASLLRTLGEVFSQELGMTDKAVNGLVLALATGTSSYRKLQPQELEDLIRTLRMVREVKGEGASSFLTSLAWAYKAMLDRGLVLMDEEERGIPLPLIFRKPLWELDLAEVRRALGE